MIDWRSGSNMFTKDECLLALKGLRALERAENFEKWNGQVAPQIKCDVIEELIKVHFSKQSKVNEWTPVTDGLPKELERVLVAYRGYYDKKIYCDNVAYIRAGDWVWNCDEDEVVVEIVAWRPLPKPYEEKENAKKNNTCHI